MKLGSHLEVQYALMTFGIPMQCSPIMADGTLKPNIYEEYLKERKEKEEKYKIEQEEQEKKMGHVLYPLSNDVLLGRGRPYQEYVGNLRLAKLVEQHRPTYQRAADRFEKTCISMDVVKLVYESGGRFLQKKKMPIKQQQQEGGIIMSMNGTKNNNNNAAATTTTANATTTFDESQKQEQQPMMYEYWEIVSDHIAREKVSHSFRTKTTTSSSNIV